MQEKPNLDKVEKIGREVKGLSPSELAAFRKWFRDFDAAAWDRQLEEDVKAGKLEALAETALKAFESGRCSEI